MLGCQLLRSHRFAGARKPDHQEDCGCLISPHPQRRIVRRPASTDSFRLARTRAGATHRHCVGDALRVRTISLHNRPHPQAGREIGVLKGIPHFREWRPAYRYRGTVSKSEPLESEPFSVHSASTLAVTRAAALHAP